MEFNTILIIVIFILTFGLVVVTSLHLYRSPRRSGLKWTIWLGGMFLGTSVFNMLVLAQMIQRSPLPMIWIVLTPPLTTGLVFIVNLFAQWLKERDYKKEAELDEIKIRSIKNNAI